MIIRKVLYISIRGSRSYMLCTLFTIMIFVENGWRCPACQHVCTELPSTYRCYCGKMHDPPYTPGDTAHSCGDMCGRLGVKPGCVHRCSLLCHPGPCPKCEALVSRYAPFYNIIGFMYSLILSAEQEHMPR